MNDVDSAHALLADACRQQITSIREAQRRVLDSVASTGVGPGDKEAVHDFRVAVRRCRTMLRWARLVWKTKRLSRIDKELGYFARTTGTLRDDEVLHDTLTSIPAFESAADEVNSWLRMRTRTGKTRRRKVARVVQDGPSLRESVSLSDKPIRDLAIVLDKLDRVLDTEPTTSWTTQALAVRAMEKSLRAVRRAASAQGDDTEAMHTLRIREKRLRYSAELFANELGKEGSRLVSHATRMQRRLGELHDLDEAIATISRARGLSLVTRGSILADLRAARIACAAKVEPLLNEARGLGAQIVLSCNESLPNSAT